MEGQPLKQRLPGQPPQFVALGADGIAIAADGTRLYYCPLASRQLYSVSVEALADRSVPDAEVAKTVLDGSGTAFAAQGLCRQSKGAGTADWTVRG